MARYVIPFLGCEGPNDRAFLLPLLRKVFQRLADAHGCELLDVFLTADYVTYSAHAQLPFVEWVRAAARQAAEFGDGDAILCIHADADTDINLALAKIEVARQAVGAAGGLPAAQLVAVVPARTIEAWVLADPDLLREQLNPALPTHQLALTANPESYPDPKQKLRETHALAHADRRRRQPARIEVGELYEVVGSEIDPQKLSLLPSFQKFMTGVEAAFRQLGYLR